MAIEVKLPNLGDGVDTGDVLELLVKEGDTVAKEQGIIELETGKATLQVPSSAAGKILKIHVKPGQTIKPGTLLLTLEAAATEAKAEPKASPQPQAAKPEKSAAPAPKSSAPKAVAPSSQPAASQPAPKPAPKPVVLPPAPAPSAPLPE